MNVKNKEQTINMKKIQDKHYWNEQTNHIIETNKYNLGSDRIGLD